VCVKSDGKYNYCSKGEGRTNHEKKKNEKKETEEKNVINQELIFSVCHISVVYQ
jgi:hypothetical protein